jgi:hypothetical protein
MGLGVFGLWRTGFGSGPVDPGHAIVTVFRPLANESVKLPGLSAFQATSNASGQSRHQGPSGSLSMSPKSIHDKDNFKQSSRKHQEASMATHGKLSWRNF